VVKPADQWNSSRIVARGAHVEHWLNGTKLLEYEVGSPDWEQRLKASKFATWAKYGRLPKGHVGIQGDHEGELAIRNMRIRTLQCNERRHHAPRGGGAHRAVPRRHARRLEHRRRPRRRVGSDHRAGLACRNTHGRAE
jgi:hypothetical protein